MGTWGVSSFWRRESEFCSTHMSFVTNEIVSGAIPVVCVLNRMKDIRHNNIKYTIYIRIF
jgi:hypothetical protein